jgi:hypothetical protein
VGGSSVCGFDGGLKLQLKNRSLNSTGPWTELFYCNDVRSRSMGWNLLAKNTDKERPLIYTIVKLDVSYLVRSFCESAEF